MKMLRATCLMVFVAVLVDIANAQRDITGPTVTPTVSIVPGSTSSIVIPKVSSVDLTSNFISGIPTTSAATAQSTQIVFVTGCNTCTSTASGAASTASIVSPSSEDLHQLSSNDLGAIIGGCAGGLVVIIIATVLICIRRRRRNRDFYAGRDFPTTVRTIPVENSDVKQSYPTAIAHNNAMSNNSFYIDTNDSTIKKYNLSTSVDNTAQHDAIQTPPVILYSDTPNQQQEQAMGVEKHVVDSGITSTSPIPRTMANGRPLERKLSQGARLSKYNFLSQAFSQMRSSYAGDNNQITMNATTRATAPKTLNTDANYHHDSMVLPHDKPKIHQHQQQQHHYDSSSENMSFPSPPPIPTSPNMASTSSFFDPHTMRESTMTVATLHAPLFHRQQQQQQRNTPTPPPIVTRSKQPYTSHLAVSPTATATTKTTTDADSVSDVSQYTTTSAAANHSKPYPYF